MSAATKIASRTEVGAPPDIPDAQGETPPSPAKEFPEGTRKRPSSRKLGRLIAVIAVVALLIAAGLAWYERPLKVRIAHARRGEAVEMVYATGFVEPEQPVSLSARVTAPVLSIRAEEGDRVQKDELLIVLDAAEQQGLLAQAQAQRRGAELAEGRIVTLYGQGWVTRAARDQAVATAAAARASEQAASARVAGNVIRAPFDGIVLKRDVEPGDLAVPGAVLMQVGDPRRKRITATVDERDIVQIHPGQEVILSSDSLPGRVLRGTVRTITPGGDPTQRAFRVRLGLVEMADLPFGLSLEANIVTKRHPQALLIPLSAYTAGNVWTLDADNRARKRRVQAGIVGSDTVEVAGGLRDGEAVIVAAPGTLKDGMRLSLER